MNKYLYYTINPTEQLFKQLSGFLYYLKFTKEFPVKFTGDFFRKDVTFRLILKKSIRSEIEKTIFSFCCMKIIYSFS